MSHLSTRSRALRPGALLVATALTLSACSSNSEGGSEEPAGSAEATTTAVEERDLALAVVSPPNSLDPAQLVDGQQMFVWSSIFGLS